MRIWIESGLAGALLVVTMMSGGVPAASPVLTIPETAGDQCVEPTPIIRREHMKLLLQQRDRTVHQGIRTGKYSLSNCVNCHVNRDPAGHAIPVNEPDQFCGSCHQFAGVQLDCFSCHATKPDE